MKIITFNIRCADDANGHSVAERAPRLKSILEKYDPDLIGFQEVTPRWLEILQRDYTDRYEMHYYFRDHGDWAEAEPVLWKKGKFTLLDRGHFWFSDTPEMMSRGWDAIGCKRICNWVKLTENESGRDFVWFNSHYGFSDPCQLASTELLLAHVREMAPNAAILTGDFNMKPSYPAYKRMTQVLSDANELTAKNPRNTYHGYSEAPNAERIDFCFVTPDTAVPLASHVIDDTVEGKYPSDHYGVMTTIALKSRETLFSLKVGQTPHFSLNDLDRSRRVRPAMLKLKPSVVLLQDLPEEFLPRMDRLQEMWDYQCVRSEGRFFAAWNNGSTLRSHEDWVSVAGESGAITRLEKGPNALTLVQAELSSCSDPLKAVKALWETVKDSPAILSLSGLGLGSEAHRYLRGVAVEARTAKGVDLTPTYHGYLDPETNPAIDEHLFLSGVELSSYGVERLCHKGEILTERDPLLVRFAY